MADYCIVGGGVAGLATAARLRAQGHRVQLFEANAHLGGKLGEVGGKGFRFDSGPSLFTLPQLVEETIEACGRKVSDYFAYDKVPVACRYFWEDGTRLIAYGDRERFSQEVEKVLGVAPDSLLAYLDHAQYVYEHTAPVFLEKSLHKIDTYLNKTTLNSLLRIHKLNLMGSLHQHNRRRLVHPKLVQLFDRYATYNGSSPYLTPGVMNSISHLEHNMGTFYPRGGMVAIPQALVQLGRDLGVEYHTEERVEEIVVEKGRVVGLRSAQAFYPADGVISNMDVVPTYRRLLASEPAPEKTLRQPRSSSALIFYWGIAASFPELDLHNIFFSQDYRREFEAIFKEHGVYEDPTIYLNISSKCDPNDAPEGGENWFVMINVPGNTGQDWDALVQSIRGWTLAKLSRILGQDIEALITYESTLDPRSIEAQTSSYQGSLYGAGSNNTMAAFLRHPNFSKRLPGLYFCGGSVHPGGGIPLCLLSAKITSEIIAHEAV